MRIVNAIFLFVALPANLAMSQELPTAARTVLDGHFPNWELSVKRIPNPCAQYNPSDSTFLGSNKCNLNGDSLPDFALAITTGKDSALVEYIVALIASDSTYQAFVLTSAAVYKGAGERTAYVVSAGDPVASFGEDTLIFHYGSSVPNSSNIAFPTDAILVSPICENWWKESEVRGYVYIGGRFRSFSAGD